MNRLELVFRKNLNKYFKELYVIFIKVIFMINLKKYINIILMREDLVYNIFY